MRDEHASLVIGQDVLDRLLESAQELGLLCALLGFEAGAREERPALGLERYLAPLPRALAQLHCSLEQGELVDPRREPAFALEVVEPSEDAHQRVVGRLEREVVQLVTPDVGESRTTSRHLEARGSEQQGVEPADRGVPVRPAQVAQKALGLLERRLGRRGGRLHRADDSRAHA